MSLVVTVGSDSTQRLKIDLDYAESVSQPSIVADEMSRNLSAGPNF